jgi:hypothetical protein
MPGPIGITVEGLNVWQHRNDVRIPPDTGTEFSLVDLLGSAPTPSVRVTATADVTERQQVRFVYAPLQLSGRGTPAAPIAFAPRWSTGFVVDASAAPQGRAIDFAATLEYRPAPRWMVFGGYRTIEGGADVDTVYTFAWLNALLGGIGVRF